jgi:hypothetical protein
MSDVPSEENVHFRFSGAVGEEEIINCASGDSQTGRILQRREVFLRGERDNAEPLPDLAQKEQDLLSAEAMPSGKARDRGVKLGEGVRGAESLFVAQLQEGFEAGGVVLVVFEEDGDENGRVKERFHGWSPGEPLAGPADILFFALAAHSAKGLLDGLLGQGLARRKDPDAALFPQGRVAAERAQGDLFAGSFRDEGVAGLELQFVAEGFGENDAAGLVERELGSHNAIL